MTSVWMFNPVGWGRFNFDFLALSRFFERQPICNYDHYHSFHAKMLTVRIKEYHEVEIDVFYKHRVF